MLTIAAVAVTTCCVHDLADFDAPPIPAGSVVRVLSLDDTASEPLWTVVWCGRCYFATDAERITTLQYKFFHLRQARRFEMAHAE